MDQKRQDSEIDISCITQHDGFDPSLPQCVGTANCVLPVPSAVWKYCSKSNKSVSFCIIVNMLFQTDLLAGDTDMLPTGNLQGGVGAGLEDK